MNRRPALVAAVLPLTLLFAACGGGDDKAATNPTSQGTSAAPSTGSSTGASVATSAPTSAPTSASPSTAASSAGSDADWDKAVSEYITVSFTGAPGDFRGIGSCVGPKIASFLGPERLATAGTPEEYSKGRMNLGKLELTRSEADTVYDDLVGCGMTPKVFKDAFLESGREEGTPAQVACAEKILNDDTTKLIVQSLFLGFTGDSAKMDTLQSEIKACAS